MDAHSRIAPSSAGVWVKCPGSVTMQEDGAALADEQSEAAREGEASHWVAASRLTSTKAINEGDVAPNGVVITREMIDYAMVYANMIYDRKIPHSKPHIEEKVQAPQIHDDSWGAVDHWTFDSRGNGTIYVDDYKYGYGLVEVFENWQMLNYAMGVRTSIKPGEWTNPNTQICMTIVQPRPYHEDGVIRSWTITIAELEAYRLALAAAAVVALLPNPTVQSGSHCRYCRARHACPAAHKAAMTAIDITGQAAIE